MEAAHQTRSEGERPKRMIYIIQGQGPFARLFSVVLKEIHGFNHRILNPEELSAAVADHRPNLMVVIEDGPGYRGLRARPDMDGVPILFVIVSETDPDSMPDLDAADRVWVMKNDAANLYAALRSILPEPVGKRILCVDDSPTVLGQIQKAFAGTPYSVSTAENGQEGLDALTSVQPDLILTDIEMPVMNGLQFCREVRSRSATAETPLIILSSRVDYETIASGFESGADEYLTKPFFPDELLNKVESFLVPPPARRKETVLVVNTSQNVTHQLRLALDKQGFVVTVADNAAEASVVARNDAPDLIISDSALPDKTGFEFCGQVRKIPSLARAPFVVMTGKTSSGARKMGRKVGVSAYLTKPFTREGVIMLVERLLAEHRSLQALEWDMVLASITSLAKALDERDPYTRFHSENVARYAVAIGRKAGLNAFELENLRLAGLLHDIGKIGIPDKVLHKPGRLTEDEFEKIKQHSRQGANILQPIPSLEEVLPGILYHHERLDGLGYPDGLKENEIPVMAQILAVADTFDALVTDRPYRQGMSKENAVQIMKQAAGTQLTPRYVDLFIGWLAESEEV